MPLSERLREAVTVLDESFHRDAVAQAIEQAAAVCAAVEAFQAAEQALKESARDEATIGHAQRHKRLRSEAATAKARLLKADLG